MSLLKFLEVEAFLEAFHVPRFSWEGCSPYNTSIRSDYLLQTREYNLKVHKMTVNKKDIDWWLFVLAKNTPGWILKLLVIIYCALFAVNITFHRSFISSVLHIWFLFSLLDLTLAIFFISYFSAIMQFEVHGGEMTKIYHGLCYLMH